METLRSTFTRQRSLSLSNNGYDLLRLVMAAMVVYTHSYKVGGYGKEPLFHLSKEQLALGSLALVGFFALSGFLVSASAERSQSIFSYLSKRVRRIFPGFWACLVVTAFVITPAIWLVKGRLIEDFPWTGPQSAGAYVTANFFLNINQRVIGDVLAGFAQPKSINGSLWTLYPEFGCYLAVAVFLVCGALRESRWMLGGGLAASYLFHVVKLVSGEQAFPNIPSFYAFINWTPYLTAFTAGACAYVWRDKIAFSLATVCVLGLGCAVTSKFGGFQLLSPLLVTAIVLCAGSCFTLRLRTDLSYGIYIYSSPCQQFLFALGVGALSVWVFFLASLVVSLGFAWLSWRFIERPALGRSA
jgi:peptidoglycan/LPS O-acetylase OafA/YrhL